MHGIGGGGGMIEIRDIYPCIKALEAMETTSVDSSVSLDDSMSSSVSSVNRWKKIFRHALNFDVLLMYNRAPALAELFTSSSYLFHDLVQVSEDTHGTYIRW